MELNKICPFYMHVYFIPFFICQFFQPKLTVCFIGNWTESKG